MPDRIIRESICSSGTIDQLSWFEEVFFYRLTVNCDDYGRFDARPAILKSRLFPLKAGITEKTISEALNKLTTVGLAITYVCEGKPILQLVTWEKYQRTRATKSKYPDPPTPDSTCCQLTSNVPVFESECESDIREDRGNPPRFIPPSLDDVIAYCKERNNSVDPQKWHDFYTSKGWMVGKNKMKDWKASVRTWEEKKSKSSTRTVDVPEGW